LIRYLSPEESHPAPEIIIGQGTTTKEAIIGGVEAGDTIRIITEAVTEKEVGPPPKGTRNLIVTINIGIIKSK
jgi:hypothetical protein